MSANGLDGLSADRPTPVAATRRAFFPLVALAMALIIFLGFAPSFFLRPLYRDSPLPAYLVVHGVIMTGWQLLFYTQVALVTSGRVDLHRRFGAIGAVLAPLVVVVGIFATLRIPSYYAEKGFTLPFPIEMLVIGNILGFVLFAGFVAFAIRFRRNPGWHRRLIYWSCIITLGPALTPSRALGEAILPYFPATFPPEIALGWVSWIALLSYDWTVSRRFHPATIIGGMLILLVVPVALDWLMLIEPLTASVRALA